MPSPAYVPDRPHLAPRFSRARDGRVVAGVASGLSQHLLIDVRWVRLFFVIGSLAGGFGGLLYLAIWVATPLAPKQQQPAAGGPRRWSTPINALLIIVAFFGGLATMQVGGGGGSVAVFVLGVVAVGAVLALQAYDRGLGTVFSAVALGFGILLVFSGVVAVAILGDSAGTSGVVVAVAATFFGIGILVVPLVLRLTQSLIDEREAKAVADQRTEIASRLHDSVLQTLALIQKQAGNPEEVARLARSQERELRAWLFDATATTPGAPAASTAPATVFAALREAAGEVEDLFGVVISPVTVGDDLPFDQATEPLVLAAREAMVNAAKHAGVERIDVYAEHLAGQCSIFVRDRGRGFDPEQIPGDRHGVKESIVGRLARAGGTARIDSAPGRGTEVELTVTGLG